MRSVEGWLMTECTAIRGTRVGVIRAARFGEPRRPVSYWCSHGHHTRAVSAVVAELWSCRCGVAAGQDQAQPPEPVIERRLKTHFDTREHDGDAPEISGWTWPC